MSDSPDIAKLEQTCQALRHEVARLKQAKLDLEANETRYQALLDGIEEGYFETDLKGNFTVVNRATAKILGYPAAELIGLNNRRYTTPETARTMFRIFNRVFRKGQGAEITDYEVVRKDGTTRTLEMSATLIHDRDGNPTGFRGLARDVSDKKQRSNRKRRLEIQRQQVQKMEAIETLAGSMALDFNNLLMSIQGNASLMGMKIDSDSPLKKNLDRINESVDQGIHLTKQLLSFAKVGKFVVTPTDLNPIVQRSTKMFSRNRENIDFKTYLKEDLWVVDVDRVQMGQALLALFMRAADDMADGGDVCIETDNVILDKEYLTPYGVEPGPYVRVSVTDSGSGLDETAQRRIFEPFFSTNGEGDHRNLGLAAVYGILRSHDGLINVYSKEGHGTTFHLYLPVSKKESPLQPQDDHRPPPGESTLLLVDDDEAILYAGARILERLGHKSLTAATGATALSLFAAHHGKIDISIIDMVMPDISAEEVLAGIRSIDPNATVYLTSGFSRNRRIDQLVEKGFDGFIQKPFTSKLLARQIGVIHQSPTNDK